MIDNARRDKIRAELQAWRDEVMQTAPGPERAAKAQQFGDVISAINSAQDDSEVGKELLKLYGVKVR